MKATICKSLSSTRRDNLITSVRGAFGWIGILFGVARHADGGINTIEDMQSVTDDGTQISQNVAISQKLFDFSINRNQPPTEDKWQSISDLQNCTLRNIFTKAGCPCK